MANKAIQFSDIIESCKDWNTSGEFYVLRVGCSVARDNKSSEVCAIILLGPAFAVYHQLGGTTK